MPHGSSDRYYSGQYKKILDTILKQLPKYISQYTPSEQPYLESFIEILRGYKVDTQEARDALSVRFLNYSKEIRSSESYYKLPFLWFVVDYFEIANRILGVTSFYGKDFYAYLVEYLRITSKRMGIFQLIREITPLNDPVWEKLQYSCNHLRVPLTNDELRILKIIYSNIDTLNIDLFNNTRLNNILKTQSNFSEIWRNLPQFFTRVDALWNFWFYPQAFGLDRMFFRFQLNNSTSMTNIIDFWSSENSTLRISRIFKLKKNPDTFIGTMIVPRGTYSHLSIYLRNQEEKGQIKLNEFNVVKDVRRSMSIAYFRAEKGWYNFSPTRRQILRAKLLTQKPRKKRKEISSTFYITHPFNQRWDFTRQENPFEIIKLFCKASHQFSYSKLPIDNRKKDIQLLFSKHELSLLKNLFDNKVLQIVFLANRLRLEFSLDEYWIVTPLMPLKQLSYLLEWLPFAQTFFTETNIHIISNLNPKMVQMLKEDLGWSVISIVQEYTPVVPNITWFNNQTNTWELPKILRK